MLSSAQEKKIKSLHAKKGRDKLGLCLVEGQKVIDEAGDFIELTFTKEDSDNFEKLVTTETPQEIAAIARIPQWSVADFSELETILILDGVQDPGNVGTIIRQCLGFDAAIILVESADPTNPKVIRSSVGAIFKTPWIQVIRNDVNGLLNEIGRDIYRLEKKEGGIDIGKIKTGKKIIVVGSEGSGIKIETNGTSISIGHDHKLESLNVASATAILLYSLYGKKERK